MTAMHCMCKKFGIDSSSFIFSSSLLSFRVWTHSHRFYWSPYCIGYCRRE